MIPEEINALEVVYLQLETEQSLHRDPKRYWLDTAIANLGRIIVSQREALEAINIVALSKSKDAGTK